MLRTPHRPSLLLLLLLSTLITTAPAARGEVEKRFRFESHELRVTDLIGAYTIEGHAGDAFEVVVTVRGEDAGPDALRMETEDGERATLRILFPEDEDRFVYPPLGKGSRTTLRGRDDSGLLSHRGKIEVRGKGRGLELWADVHIRVPQGGRLHAIGGVGSMRADQVQASLELHLRSGEIQARSIVGALLAETGSGNLRVEDIHGDVNADTGSGSVTLARVEATRIGVDTGSGKVDVREVACRELVVDTGSGSVDARSLRADGARIDTGSGSVRLELDAMGAGDFAVDTGSGSIVLNLPEPASARISASTGSGSIDIRVENAVVRRRERDAVEFEVGEGDARVRLETGSGGIRIAAR